MPGCIDRLLIDQHGVDHAAHLDELLPVPAVASKARDLAGTDRADLAQADLRDHALEAGSLHSARGRTAEVVVDHLDLRPPERRQPIPHGVLQRAALTVVQHLMGRGLPHIKQRLALQMMGANLVRDHDRTLWRAASLSSRHGRGSTASSGWSVSLALLPADPAMRARRWRRPADCS